MARSQSDKKREQTRARGRPTQDVLARASGRDIVAHGWTLLFHPALVEQLEKLTAAALKDIARAKANGTSTRGTTATANQKVVTYLLAAILDEIPQNPGGPQYEQGNTLGPKRRHWKRDKFGAGRFRLFFRHRTDIELIVYGWVNDRESLRTYGSSTDAYRRFGEQLDADHPPDDWDALVAEASAERNRNRVADVLPKAKQVAD